ncbi:hypothetical protein Tco_0487248 [Tanacetum coccineum]
MEEWRDRAEREEREADEQRERDVEGSGRCEREDGSGRKGRGGGIRGGEGEREGKGEGEGERRGREIEGEGEGGRGREREREMEKGGEREESERRAGDYDWIEGREQDDLDRGKGRTREREIGREEGGKRWDREGGEKEGRDGNGGRGEGRKRGREREKGEGEGERGGKGAHKVKGKGKGRGKGGGLRRGKMRGRDEKRDEKRGEGVRGREKEGEGEGEGRREKEDKGEGEREGKGEGGGEGDKWEGEGGRRDEEGEGERYEKVQRERERERDCGEECMSRGEVRDLDKAVEAKGTLKKSLVFPRWRLLMAQIIQCLGGKTRGFDQITNKDAIILYSLANEVNIDYAKLIWKDIITKLNKKTREKVVPYNRFLSLLLEHKMKGMEMTMCQWNIKLPIPLPTQGRRIPKAKRSKLEYKFQDQENFEDIFSFGSALEDVIYVVFVQDRNIDEQATGGPTTLGVTSYEGAKPQLSSGMSASKHDVSAKSKAGADSGLSAPKDLISQTTGNDEGPNKLSLDHIFVGVDFIDLDSQANDPIIRKLKLDKNKAEAEVAILSAQSSFPNLAQLTELLVKSLQPKFSMILSAHDFSSSLPIELKELPSKFNELTGEVNALKKHVHDLEIELPGDLKEIPNKLGIFTSTIENKGKKAIFSKDAEEEGSKSDSDDTIHLTGSMVESSKKKKFKKFDFVTKNGDHVHLIEEQIKEQKRIEESAKAEAAKHEVEVRKKELVDLIGPYVVSKYYKSKLRYDKYCDKMLNRRASSKITNCDVLTRKGHITLKIYREDMTSEVILNFKASDLHLGIDLDKPLSEQDPVDKLNDLAKKKRKNADDIHDYFKANRRILLPLNEMLYTIQEIFFRLHQGHGLDDHAKTFSSLLLAEVDNRNLNPLKQIRTIKQLRR